MDMPVQGIWLVLAGIVLAGVQYFYPFAPEGFAIVPYGFAIMLAFIGILNWNVK